MPRYEVIDASDKDQAQDLTIQAYNEASTQLLDSTVSAFEVSARGSLGRSHNDSLLSSSLSWAGSGLPNHKTAPQGRCDTSQGCLHTSCNPRNRTHGLHRWCALPCGARVPHAHDAGPQTPTHYRAWRLLQSPGAQPDCRYSAARSPSEVPLPLAAGSA